VYNLKSDDECVKFVLKRSDIMAVPKRKVSKTRQGTHRAHMALSAKEMTTCPSCGAIIKPHRVCPKCGEYKGKKVIKDDKE
jgi:large subunit ribosomal protein L32